jgi:exosortase
MERATWKRAAVLLAGLAFLWLYARVFATLASDWTTDDNYSHGFFILPLALYFVWERRARLASLTPRPSVAGLLVVLFGLAVFLAGVLGADRFLPRVSLLIVLAGSVVYLAGWNMLRAMAFPLAFLLLMVPLPALIFNEIAFPLQILASRAGEAAMVAVHVPVLREGNVMILAHTTLEVAEACSGIRSLISLLTLGLVFGYFSDPRSSVRWVVALSTIPVAILDNAVRVAGTGIAAQYYGDAAAEGFFHTFSGWLLFIVACLAVALITRIASAVLPDRQAPAVAPAS